MLDLAKRSGVVGPLIEENKDVAPEFIRVPVKARIAGTQFKTKVRKSLPSVGFRNLNEGSETVKSEYAQELAQCHVIDPQIEVDEAILAADDLGQGAGGILADEASGVMQAIMLHVGRQFYYGSSNDAKGFSGCESFVDSTMVTDATGSTATTGSSVYGVKFGRQGVGYILGGGTLLKMNTWARQQITRNNAITGDPEKLMAFVNNLMGWIGLDFGHTKAISRIYNLTAQSGKGLTDDLASDDREKWPVGMKPDVYFATKRSVAQLQRSRTALGQVAYAGGAIAPWPTEMNGIPIIETDSLDNTETIGQGI